MFNFWKVIVDVTMWDHLTATPYNLKYYHSKKIHVFANISVQSSLFKNKTCLFALLTGDSIATVQRPVDSIW